MNIENINYSLDKIKKSIHNLHYIFNQECKLDKICNTYALYSKFYFGYLEILHPFCIQRILERNYTEMISIINNKFSDNKELANKISEFQRQLKT